MKIKQVIALIILSSFLGSAWAERIKDITSIKGVRDNQLVGYGLVVGLDGSGDQTSQTPFTVQSLKSMLAQYGITLPANVNPQVKNIAAVSIHASLPAFAKIGQNIDVTVSSLGNAKSLREIANPFASGDKVTLHLKRADFTTAKRLADTINQVLGPNNAHAKDSVTVAINAPKDVSQRVGFVSFIENLEFQPGEAAAKVIINSRSGTVVIGNHVKVYSAAVSHGSMTVTITNTTDVDQPPAFSGGETAQNVQSDIEVTAEDKRMFRFPEGVTLSEIVRAVNQVGASPGDLVAILESLKQVGALSAELIVI